MRILIADDEGVIRMGLKRMLNELGHEVISATNGREALEMARRHQPDLAILDIQMPFTDGLQVAKTLSKKQPIPILFLTAFSQPDLVEKATDLPISAYLIKPIQAEELNAAIMLAVKRFAEQQRLAKYAGKLQTTLADRKLVEKAKGKLMAQGLTEEKAHLQLQRDARQQNKTLAQIAQSILDK